MANEIQPVEPPAAGGEMPSAFHVRTIVIRPSGPAGKLAFAAALVAAGVVFFTVGLALLAALAVAATAAGVAVAGYRAFGGKPDASPSIRPLDPTQEIFLKKPED